MNTNALRGKVDLTNISGSAEMLRRVVDSSPDCVKILDLDARLLWMSEPGRRSMQLDESEDVVGAAWLEFWKGEDRIHAEAAVASAAAGGTGRFSGFCPTAKGVPRWWDVIVTAMFDGNGQPEQLLSVSRDITDRKRSEDMLQRRQLMLDEAQRVARMGSWELHIASGRVEWSAELTRIFGLQPGQTPHFEPAMQLIHADDVAGARASLERAVVDHQPFVIEFRIVRPDRSVRSLVSHGEVLLNPEGKAERMIGVCHDVTERIFVEQMEAGQREIKVGIAAQRPLAETLTHISRLHEALNPGSLCSLLLLDVDGKSLIHGAAPSLPEAYNQAVNGQEIGDGRGSCGTAAWRRERVVVADIANHPYWENYREFTLIHGLRACWSTPVFGVGGQVLGTFAVYYREVREPSPGELESIDKLLAVAAIAIESARLIDRLRVRDRFFDMSLEIFCVFDPLTAQFIQVNPAFTDITGYSQAEMTARQARHFVHPDDRKLTADAMNQLSAEGGELREFSNRYLCRNGGHRWLQWTIGAAPDGLVYAAARDITEQRKVDSQLAHAISHDVITGLPHHLLFERVLASQLEEPSAPVWIFFLGLDRFQSINESMGHTIGDEVLRQVAERLCGALGETGEIARFAGDEFIIAATALDQSSALELAAQLRAAIAPAIEVGDCRLLLTASIGISHSPDHGQAPQDLLRRAEAAMARAKRQGRDCVCEFSVEQMLDIEDRLLLGSHLRGAIQRGELQLHYQPQHHAASRALSGFEALLRWNSQTLGPVPPGRFIPVAEALGLMPEIGAWVLNEACRQASIWMDQGHRGFNIAVNVVAPQLQRPGFVAEVRDALVRNAVPAEVLSIELTESALMENVVRVRGTLVELKTMGVQLSLDDFGTGYSSLAYLKQFPIDKLKIDQSFVRGLPDDGDDAVIARTIVAMAHQLRMAVAAEGVETQAQALYLRAIGCDELQGYLLGRPVPADEAEAFFPADRKPCPSAAAARGALTTV